ncbi:MAG: TonB-dependent receptor [Betaproteobacteria bacterium]
MSSINLRRSGPLAAAIALAVSGTAVAASAAGPKETLEEVVVTAQKRAERLIDVPISMAAITEGALRDAGATQLGEVLGSVPGVSIVDSGSGTQNIEIRGINSIYGNSPVGYYLDELPFTYLGNTQLPDVRMYDVERVEVLRGPQGTLYGDGSLGGTIRVLTNEPNLTKLQFGVDLDGRTTKAGSSSNTEQGMLNLPLVDNSLALRLVGSHEDLGGWVDNPATGVKDQNDRTADTYRGKLRYAPSDRLDIVLSAWHTKEHVLGDSTSLADYTSTDPVTDNTTLYNLYAATVRYKFDSVDVVSATSKMQYHNIADIADYFGFGAFNTEEHIDVFSEELRLASRGTGMFRWTSGVAYRSVKQQTNLELPAFGITQDQQHKSDSYAIFGEATWSFTKKLDLTLGLRVFKDDQQFHEPVDPAILALIQGVNPEFTGTTSPSFHTVNPKVNLAYHFTDNWLGYATAAKGFRTGQAQPVISLESAILHNPPISIPIGIDPETLWSYEVGTKGQFADGLVTVEADVFYNSWKNLQTVVFPAPRIGALINGGPARTEGVEFGLGLRPVKGLTLQLTGSLINAKYTSDVAGTNVHDGDSIIGVPKSQFGASGMYRWPITPGLNGFARAEVQHTSPRSGTILGLPDSDSITAVNARFGVETGAWGVYFSAENLTNESGAVDIAASGNSGVARLRPRTLGLQVTYKHE